MNKRLFIAINFSVEIKNQVTSLLQDLKRLNQDTNIKWVAPENLHLTVHFLGSVDEKHIHAIKQAITLSLHNMPVINYQSSEINGFPNLQRPRVIYVGLKGPDIGIIAVFHENLRQKLIDIGIHVDNKPWKAHITLGRVKSGNNANLNLAAQIEPFKGTFDSVDLMESQLTPGGPIYTKVFTINLAN